MKKLICIIIIIGLFGHAYSLDIFDSTKSDEFCNIKPDFWTFENGNSTVLYEESKTLVIMHKASPVSDKNNHNKILGKDGEGYELQKDGAIVVIIADEEIEKSVTSLAKECGYKSKKEKIGTYILVYVGEDEKFFLAVKEMIQAAK